MTLRPLQPLCIAVCVALALSLPAAVEAQEPGGPAPLVPQPGAGAPETRYYLSNDLGMALEEIGWYRREEAAYVLAVQSSEGGEVRTLFKDGIEVERWAREEREERVYKEGKLVERLLLDPAGRRSELREFEGGDLVRRTEFSYSGPGQITARVYDGEGNLQYTDRSLLSSEKTLREVRRESAHGERLRLGLSMSRDRLVEERAGGDGRTLIKRYDPEGRPFEQERWIGGRLAERQVLSYAAEGDRVATATVVDYLAGRTTVQSFDESGYLVRLEIRRDGKVVEETHYERDQEGRTILAFRRGAAGLEQWRYEYDEQGDLVREEYRLRGSLERVTWYEEGERRVDELYRDGAMFMRVAYDGGEKVQEEFLRDGAVVRTREYR